MVRVAIQGETLSFTTPVQYAAWHQSRLPKSQRHLAGSGLSLLGSGIGFLADCVIQAISAISMSRRSQPEVTERFEEPLNEAEAEGYGYRITHENSERE